MSNLPISTRAFTATGLLCFGTAAFIAGCGGGASSSVPATQNPAVASGTTCALGSGGVAYIPDGAGSSNGGSLTIIPFETTSGTFDGNCANKVTLGMPVSINDLAISSFGIGLALQSNNQFIGISGITGQSPHVYQNPQPFPNVTGATPLSGTSLVIFPAGNFGLALGTNYPGFVGLNDFFGVAPTSTPAPATTSSPTPAATSGANGSPSPTVTQTPLPFAGITAYANVYTGQATGPTASPSPNVGLDPAGVGTRTSIALAPKSSTMLVRGSDLAAFQFNNVNNVQYISFPADMNAAGIATPPPMGISTTLGFPSTTNQAANYAKGLIAFYPGDSSQAVIGQTSTSATALTRVTGLPNSITPNGTASVPSTITSVAVDSSDDYAIVGTQSSGVYVWNLSNLSTPIQQSAISSSSSITSVGVSADTKFVLVQIGNTLTVYNFSNGTISAVTPAPSASPAVGSPVFTLPATAHGDYMVVR